MIRFARRRPLVVGVAIALAVVVVVTGVVAVAGGGSGDDVVLAPWTRVLDDEEAAGLAIEDDRIIIPADHRLADVATDDVLALGLTPQTPDGMLRRVTSVRRGEREVVARTRQAELGEVFESADFSTSVPLTFDDIDSVDESAIHVHPPLPRIGSGVIAAVGSPGAPPAVLRGAQREPTDDGQEPVELEVEETERGFAVSFDEVLYDRDDDEETKDDQVTLTGALTMAMAFDLDLSVSRFALDSATIAMDGSVSTNLELRAREQGQFKSETELFAIEFSPIVVPIGLITFVFRPRMPVVLGYEGEVTADVETSATATATALVGIEYRGGRWRELHKFESDFQFQPPALDAADTASVSVFAGPRFEFRLWEGLAAASVGVDGTVRLEFLSATPWACLYAGVRAPVRFEVLGDKVVDRSLFERERLLVPDRCESGESLPDPVDPVPAYSRVLGTCTPTVGDPVGEFGYEVLALDDGGVLVASKLIVATIDSAGESSRHPRAWLVRLDAAGDVVWERTYDVDGHPTALVTAGDGFVLALDEGALVFVDQLGALRDAKELAGMRIEGMVAAPGGDGFLVRGSPIGESVAALARLERDGTVRWAHSYVLSNTSWGRHSRGAAPRHEGGWNVALADGFFLAVDDAGVPLRSLRLEQDGRPLFQNPIRVGGAPGGELAVAINSFGGGSAIVSLDSALEVATMFAQEAADPRAISKLWVQAVERRSDGSLVAVGEVQGRADRDLGILFQRVAPDGALQWSVEYSGGDPNATVNEGNTRAVTTTADGGIVAVGTTWSLAAERCGRTFDRERASQIGQESTWDLWVVKVPPTGLMTPREDSGLARSVFDSELPATSFGHVSVDVAHEPADVQVAPHDGRVEVRRTTATVRSQAP